MGKRNRHYENNERTSSSNREGNIWPIIQSVLLLVLILQLAFVGGKIDDLHIMPTGDMADDTPKAAPSALSQPSGNNIDMKALMDDDDVKGNKDATVTIVEFSDFECPFCARFYRDTYGQIVTKYIDTGKVNLVFRDFPLSFHKQAQKAAESAECAGEQGKYYEMHDVLFEKGVAGGVTSFKQFASDLGLDTNKFNTCLDSGAMASEVKKDMADGQKAGVRGTPGFVINGELISGAQPFSVFEAAIEKALGN